MFGSGANHRIYAQFMAQSALAKKGSQGWPSLRCWYPNGSMVLCHDASLTPPAATGGNHPSTKNFDLNLNNSVRATVRDIKDNKFW